jgi:class 3 adenylate cyclase
MIFLIFYIFIYCNADVILNKFYLSNSEIMNNELIKNNENFYYCMTTLNVFALSIYSIYIIKNIIYYKPIYNYSIGLALIYIKYIINSLISNNTTLCQHEFSRNIMWLFATPLMLKMYCNVNKINLLDINFHYHVIPIAVHIFIYPYKNTSIYYFLTGILWILIALFINTLYKNKHNLFTNIYLFIWFIFMCITFVDILQITNSYNINLYYLAADIASKIITNIIINDYYEREMELSNNMDLQSIMFVNEMIKNIKRYKNENINLTCKCSKFINFVNNQLLDKIPYDKSLLKNELLKKILPLDFDKSYISQSSLLKQFNMICVLFTDIVNYTELANKYSDKIIFKLLHSVYSLFDNIIKKYRYLQKIETIGDAYMVVGDIFRNYLNEYVVIEEILLFAIEIRNEIKNIITPDNKKLSIRIGINIGDVSIGLLGNEIPRLCIVGNTVNIASRLQTTAEIDTIQFSEDIYKKMSNINFNNKFEITKKENVFLKNIGSVTTYNINNEECIN